MNNIRKLFDVYRKSVTSDERGPLKITYCVVKDSSGGYSLMYKAKGDKGIYFEKDSNHYIRALRDADAEDIALNPVGIKKTLMEYKKHVNDDYLMLYNIENNTVRVDRACNRKGEDMIVSQSDFGSDETMRGIRYNILYTLGEYLIMFKA